MAFNFSDDAILASYLMNSGAMNSDASSPSRPPSESSRISTNGDQALADGPGSSGSRKSPVVDKDSEEYQKRRDRNNLAVRKSRMKSKVRSMQAMDKMNQIEAENKNMRAQLNILSNEFKVMKDIFLRGVTKMARKAEADELEPRLDEMTCPVCHLDAEECEGHEIGSLQRVQREQSQRRRERSPNFHVVLDE